VEGLAGALYTCVMHMTEKLIQRYSGQGKLIFQPNQEATVSYLIEEFQGYDGEFPTFRDTRGRISNEGHPDWHPATGLHPGPFTLVMSDGRKLKVFLSDLHGSFKGTGEFF
jgi:hypothetical protein